ncbi:hypothetical protein ACIBCA_33155 [Kitasatospora sp. NPDC051170]|uniref:hypothetical protein n=1 Tax=Kitasatospora sp. NPDC051170 TaxID=3364056 RepID=UPI0037A777C2
MTASAPSSPRPGRAATAGRPAALWVLLLVALLTMLPCAGQARALDAIAHPAPAHSSAVALVTAAKSDPQPGGTPAGAAQSADQRRYAEDQGHWILCSADGEQRPGNGCSSHPFCPQDAQLPNPPPQPQPAVTLLPAVPEAPSRVLRAGLLDGPRPAPDLHVLQVQRS